MQGQLNKNNKTLKTPRELDIKSQGVVVTRKLPCKWLSEETEDDCNEHLINKLGTFHYRGSIT